MSAQSVGKLLMAGGALIGTPEKETVCKAFEAAVNEWCGAGGKSGGGEFNDVFMKNLNDPKVGGAAGQKIFSQMEREVGGVFSKGKFEGFSQTLAMNPTTGAGMVAVAMEDAFALALAAGKTLGGAQGAASQAVRTLQGIPNNFWRDFAKAKRARNVPGWMWKTLKGAKFYSRHADAMYKGKVFEIKGPGDKFHGAQGPDAQKMSGNSDPYVASCESCGLQCRSRCPKELPVKKA